MKVLVVDDDLLMLETISTILEKDGYHVIVADNGYRALDLLTTRKFDLVLCDIMMPNFSGLSLLSVLKKHYAHLPVILLSSLDKSEIILSAVGMGAEDFILKPINFLELSIRIKKILTSVNLLNLEQKMIQ
jgi:DNA-binding response OmpR family regulator